MFSVTFSKALVVATVAGAVLLAGCAGGPLLSGGPPHSDEQLARIQRGMTRDDVQRIVGSPDEAMRFPMSQTEAWDYQYQDSWGYFAIFSVTFGTDGRAVSTFSRRIDGGDHGNR